MRPLGWLADRYASTARAIAWWCCASLLAHAVGCTRTHYRVAADTDSYTILDEKSCRTPWQLPPGYSIIPDPRSRLYDPTPIDDPLLPIPAPQLYAYGIPALPPRSEDDVAGRGGRGSDSQATGQASQGSHAAASGAAGPELIPPPDAPIAVPPVPFLPGDTIPGAGEAQPIPLPADPNLSIEPNPDMSQAAGRWPVVPVTYLTVQDESQTSRRPLAAQDSMSPDVPIDPDDQRPTERDPETGIPLVPLPASAWETIPETCLARMFEFDRMRAEYERSFKRPPSTATVSQRLSLRDIVDVALLNSREYQTQKEILYRTALRLSLARFAYETKFSAVGNRTAAIYNHNRSGGETINTLGVPTTLQGDKLLVTGGDILARFANDVVLTFNGPNGFASDISSQLVFGLSQTVFQIDVVFEPLTQAERDVVYAARDFLRFRKQLFVLLASDYYSLIRNYRQIEIDALNYFTLVRALRQGEAEFQAGILRRIQLEQIEQNTLAGRSTLIRSCNTLEGALDRLKIRMGLPPETPLWLDLGELDRLTLRDELEVTGDLVRRAREQLVVERQQASPNRGVMINSAVVLVERMVTSFGLRQQLAQDAPEFDTLADLRARMLTDEARLDVRRDREELELNLRAVPPAPPIRIFQRTMDLVDSLVALARLERDLLEREGADSAIAEDIRNRQAELQNRAERLRESLENALAAAQIDAIEPLVEDARRLLTDVEALVADGDRALGIGGEPQIDVELAETVGQVDQLLASAEQLEADTGGGLKPVDIDWDAAMLTAVTSRLDLMNERGLLADDWRRVKLAGDELRSVLNLNATHTIRTEAGVNQPFNFTFDESNTRLSATLDLPLNRFAQRNEFRQSLINYQVGRRSLMQLEDTVKLATRNDLRSLDLANVQYLIAVASAALAFERVISTQLELQLGFPGVQARDFLEAQDAYTRALAQVADNRIGYIVNRMQLFFDLELLQVGQTGFWEELYQEDYQPQPQYQLPCQALPAYGTLPPYLWYSKRIRRMQDVPTGTSYIWSDSAIKQDSAGTPPVSETIPPPPGEQPRQELPPPTAPPPDAASPPPFSAPPLPTVPIAAPPDAALSTAVLERPLSVGLHERARADLSNNEGEAPIALPSPPY